MGETGRDHELLQHESRRHCIIIIWLSLDLVNHVMMILLKPSNRGKPLPSSFTVFGQ